MYTEVNFKTKKELKEALKRGEKLGYYQPGPFGGDEPEEGTIYLEGPHYPQPHTWYATAKVKDGLIIGVK
jgi:hypothetical protein